ncbi:histone H2B type 1-A-like [Tachysurus vachellii]|uniref:histone H2B type 1-A-like n=1 Tax=Tachysurus vachellii TaxID=175792 RepID=UPI00296B2F9A|nr:histone H2B type 1-A-like [Tachysurus vachellii]
MKTPHNGAGLRKQTQKRASRKSLRPTKAYCIYIYKLNKSSPAVKDTVAVPGWLCTRVGTEAARLAKFNRRGTITQREVCCAVRALSKVTRRTTAHAL